MATASYDPVLVGLSIAIAVFASFTGLSLARRAITSNGPARRIWLVSAALALGGGIWSMHFVGMLAFSVAGIQMRYEFGLTAASFIIPIVLTGWAVALAAPAPRPAGRLLAAGLVMGSGVLAMHYLGMAAMNVDAAMAYDRRLVAASAIIALVASTVAVWLAFGNHTIMRRLSASLAMGVAIAGMHYTAMAAARFTPGPGQRHAEAAGIDHGSLATLIALFSVGLLGLGLGAARLDTQFRRYERREARTVLRLQVADILREKASGDALDEIAALMGAHFGVTRTGYAQLDPVEEVFDYDVCWTDGTVPPLLGRYPSAAFGEKIVAALAAGRTIIVEDLLSEEISDEDRTRATAREVDTRSILVVPFVRNNRLRSIVYLNDREPRQWHADDIAFMEELAERTRLVIERDTVEQQLRALNATLEKRVEERTRELEQAQEALLQSQKMEAVGQLAAGMAHDFNNVLASVASAYNLILRRPDDPDRVRRFAEAGAQATERGAKLTSQLMAFSRSQKIQPRPILLCDVLAKMEVLLARTLGPLIRLEKQLNPNPAPVLADAVQVEMMVLNLAINARDAMPEGGTLTITTSKCTLGADGDIVPGDYIELAVRDTGTGMDADTLRRAMEPFFTTKPVGKGTGLGLAQIYGSVRQAGGTVRIESALGQGTTVRVFLPCTDEQPYPLPSGAHAGAPNHSATPRRVLLIDDDHDLRVLLAETLADLGHLVTCASCGEDALATLDTVQPDVAVMDFAMPDMNGAVVAEHLVARCPDLPIIFASGYPDTDAIRKAAGEDAVILRKPFEVAELARAIEEAIGRKGAPGKRSG